MPDMSGGTTRVSSKVFAVCRSLAADLRSKSKTVAKPGQGSEGLKEAKAGENRNLHRRNPSDHRRLTSIERRSSVKPKLTPIGWFEFNHYQIARNSLG